MDLRFEIQPALKVSLDHSNVGSVVMYCTHMVSMKLQNMRPLQEWPVLDAVSQRKYLS